MTSNPWYHAPKWAQWVAKDGHSGVAWFYDTRPRLNGDCDGWRCGPGAKHSAVPCRGAVPGPWKESCRKRPAKAKHRPKKPHVYRDKQGWRIEEGDLLKSFHFLSNAGDRRYLYHVVGKRDNELWAYHFTRAANCRGMSGSCPLAKYMASKLHKGVVEIIAWNQLQLPSQRKA